MKPVYTDITLPVSGMSCAACAASVESMLTSLNGVFSASVNYATSTVHIRFNPLQVTLDQFQAALKPIGYDLVISASDDDETFEQLELKRHNTLRRRLVTATVFSLPVFVISMLWHHPSSPVQWLLLALSLPVIFYSGQGFYLNAFRLGVRGKTNMDTLVAIGTAAAFVLSLINTLFPDFIPGDGINAYVYYESAVVIITLILLGRFLEERSRGKASAAISRLMHLQPQTAIRLKGNNQEEVAIRHLLPGDTVLIRPGAVIPVDGIVVSGGSWIEESMMSGEPVPVFRKTGDQVLAGTINKDSVLQVTTLKTGKETTLSRIIAMVDEAQNSKPPVQLLVDKISAVFVPAVILISIATFIVWALIIPDQPLTYAIVTSISVLIIACPCA
ncbi:MAG TPA: HAD-IC family P-type ATPase, partial [Lentimicrobium sp.]|nr:HAD-IC family P-type ATPase [Lentimicrobium sp.]